MAKRAKKQVAKADWQEGNEGKLKELLANRTVQNHAKSNLYLNDSDSLSQLVKACELIPEEVKRPAEWAAKMAIKYGIPDFDEAIRRTAPRHIIVKTKKDFESKLTREQILQLLPVMNNYIFVEKQSVESVNMWLRCENEEPVKVKDNGLLAYLLHLLQKGNYICFDCQGIAEEGKVFVGLRGKILTKSNLSKSMTYLVHKMGYPIKGDNVLNEDVYNAVMGLGK